MKINYLNIKSNFTYFNHTLKIKNYSHISIIKDIINCPLIFMNWNYSFYFLKRYRRI